jgi:hypothetical protein
MINFTHISIPLPRFRAGYSNCRFDSSDSLAISGYIFPGRAEACLFGPVSITELFSELSSKFSDA